MTKQHIPKNMNPYAQHLNIKKLDKNGLPKKKLLYSIKSFFKKLFSNLKLGIVKVFQKNNKNTIPDIDVTPVTEYGEKKVY
jgi:hypothetical protein